MNSKLPIVDRFGRIHSSLRISVTDRCNIRCFYCMPETVQFLPRKDVLTFEEITQLVQVFASLGVDRIRITGGEPLVRSELWKLIAMLRGIDGIKDIALTTNGILLAPQAAKLHAAGLDRLNVSLDTVDAAVFEKITRRKGLEKVIEGITAAKQVGFQRIRINAVSIAQLTETEVIPLVRFAVEHSLELRFIEFMPLDGDDGWQTKSVLTGAQVRGLIEAELGKLRPAERADSSQPATDYLLPGGQGVVGFIDSVSQPFCESCNRMRITAEGQLRNCLFSEVEWDLRKLLRSGASVDSITTEIRNCIAAKKLGHGSDDGQFLRPTRAMYQIGG